MSEKANSLEERNEAQKRLIHRQVDRIKELEVWEKFAAHLVHNCVGQTVTPENLERWMTEATARRTK